MGCTSSAPMSDYHSHTTENDKTETNNEKNDKETENLEKDIIKKEEKPVQTDFDDLECNVIKMLPPCDNLEKNIQLDRSSNSPPDVTTEESDMTDLNGGEGNEIKGIEETIPNNPEDQPQKVSTFQELVDQAVLDSILDDITKIPDLKEDDDDEVEIETIDNSNEIKNADNEDVEEIKHENDDEEDHKEAVSPSQSECSRATRWEALADIAAELPPSLAVDPLTGQIFSLSK